MVLRKTVNRQIWRCEGFEVKIKHDGRVIKSNCSLPVYTYKNALKNVKSVAQWKIDRFSRCYPGYEVDVLDAKGKVARGKTKLGTVRDTYLEG
ncbi:MAG: hypothetical protein MUO80_02200 [Dehalococcoidia bacterium]|nr:hypothetical protein [Dehalococcoidia bacterium]